MAVVLPRIKAVYEYARDTLLRTDEDAFTKALHEIVDLTFEAKACKGSMTGVSLMHVKDGYTSQNSVELEKNGKTVGDCLKRAYTAYHTGGRPLPYDMYRMFVGVCHTWGKLLNLIGQDNDMESWQMEAERTPGDMLLHARMPATPQMCMTRSVHMRELLDELQRLNATEGGDTQ